MAHPPSHKPQRPTQRASSIGTQHDIIVGLNAVIVTVHKQTPCVLVVRQDQEEDGLDSASLPSGPFEPARHPTLETGLRAWVQTQTYLDLGYVEQLYTFGDRGREAPGPGEVASSGQAHSLSIGYLALTRDAPKLRAPDNVWQGWYRYLPWEDWRESPPRMIAERIEPALNHWADAAPDKTLTRTRRERARSCFGFGDLPWDEEKVLERYELLFEAGLVAEAHRGRTDPAHVAPLPGTQSMNFDHRRILATGMGRLRGKLKYRPVVFELMPPTFTLLQLQRTVEAISGVRLHKQNFRRLVEKEGLVEGTGKLTTKTGGRPAEQFRFRREVMSERPAPGLRVPPITRR